jgi:chaperone required for assembly of F1-ATPase
MMQLSKRFYSHVSVRLHEGQYQVLLDGTVVRNGAVILQHSSPTLMQIIAHEWEAQTDVIDMLTMAHTRLLFSVLMMDDAITAQHKEIIMEYACNDTLCYHAAEHTPLADKQRDLWGRWIAWACAFFSAEFRTTHSIMPLEQSTHTKQALKDWLDAQDNTTLLMLYILTDALKSFIIAVALVQNAITVEDAVNTVWLEHDEQSLQWGIDAEYTTKRLASQQLAESVCQFYSIAVRLR